MKLLRAALRPLLGALPFVRAAWGVTARMPSHQRSTLAAHARRALPLVGTAWGVTARKAYHNASNARGVTAGKMVCVCQV